MNNPVKIIYKYKNNKNRIQYQLYIFIGSLVDNNIIKILNKIRNLNFYDTLIYLTSKDIELLVKHYGDKWYYKLFIFNHIKASINSINNNNQMRNTLIEKLGKEWVESHLLITSSNKIIYSYQNLVKDIYKKKNRNKNSIINNKIKIHDYKISKQYEGGNDDNDDNDDNDNDDNEYDEDDEDVEDDITNDLEINEKDNDDDNDDDEDDFNIDEIIDNNSKKTSDIINNIIDTDNNNKLKNKLVVFDTSKYDKPYDEIISNIYYKNYVFHNYIFDDDTIKNIKNKICTSIEFPNNISYCLPSRMYLWSEYDYYDIKKNDTINEKVMLGQKWIIRNELLKIDIEPINDTSIYQNLKGNLKYLKDNIRRYGSRIKREDDNTNILDDYKDYITNNEIYLINIYNELGNNYNGTSEQTKNLYDVYVKIYFGDITNEDFNHIIQFLNSKSDYDKKNEINKIQLNYQNINNSLLIENEVINTVEKMKMEQSNIYTNYFKDNYITHTNILLNLIFTNKYSNDKLDLYRIFDNFILSDKYPFIQLHSANNNIIYKFYENKIINKWFENNPYGLVFKLLLSEKQHLTINLNENGRLEYKTQWKEEDNIKLDDIKKTYTFIYDLITKINKENKTLEIIKPNEYNFKYGFINSIQHFTIPDKFSINHNDLSDFARYFFPYISIVVEPRKRKSTNTKKEINNISKYGTYLRFKRISKYENETKINFRIIHFLKNYEFIPNILAKEISNQFNITEKEAFEKIMEISKKFPNLKKSRKILKKLENLPKYKLPGIDIGIQGKSRDNYKIRISGTRNKIQLNNILTFLHTFIHLYIETYLKKNKDKQILKKKLEQLTNIAKRRNMVQELVVQEETSKVIKQITKIDKERIGFKPDKGQNQWSRLCQNSGNVNRRPVPYTTPDELIKKGFVNNNGEYERKVKTEKIKAAKLDDGSGNSVYWACNPEDNKEYVHIGFLSRSNNPNGLCMPCCFKKNPANSVNKQKKDYHLKCIGKLKNATNDIITIGDKLYILQESNKIIPNRFGFLSDKLDNLFNIGKKINIANHYLVQTDGYYLKFGTLQDSSSYLQSIACALDISCDDLKNKIIKNTTEQIFISLNNGDIKIQFKTIENYIEYIKNTDNLDYDLLDDLISTPGVIIPEGLNIYILQKVNNNYNIVCKNIENIIYFSDPVRKNILLLFENNIYSTIFKVFKKEKEKNFIIFKTFNYDSNNIINTIWKYMSLACKPINLNNEHIPYAKQLYTSLKNKNINVKLQVIDNRYRCKFLVLDNNLLLPVRSSGSLYNIPIITDFDKYLHTLDKTLELIKDIYSIPNGLVYNNNNNDRYTISALIFVNYYLPVVESEYSKTELDSLMPPNYHLSSQLLYEDIDKKIQEKTIIPDERVYAVNLNSYKNEGYELFRFEISNILQLNKDKYKIINKLLNILDKHEKMLEIKKFLYSIIHKTAYDEFNKLINNNNNNIKTIDNFVILDEINKIEKYDINNQRNTCNIFNKENDCNNNPHCIFNNNKCKMKLSKDQMIDYVNQLTSELVYNEIKQKEILQADGYFVSDIRNINLFIQRDKQTIVKHNNNIKNIFKQIFGKDNLPIIGKRKIKIMNKLQIEDNNNYPLIHIGNVYYQEVYNYDTIIRAYTNAFFWHMNTFAVNSVRNLGYYSILQNQILNYFKSLIYTWIIHEQNINNLYTDIDNINIPINKFVDIFKNKLEYKDNNSIYIIILYILNKYHNIPILIYDQYDTIIHIIDRKLIPLNNKNKYKPNECLNIKILINKIITIYIK
jgi:hypothetical protein